MAHDDLRRLPDEADPGGRKNISDSLLMLAPRQASAAAGLGRQPSERTFEWLVYLALIIPITIFLNLTFINLHGPDDFDHVKRAYTVFHHPFQVLTPAGQSSGAMVDRGLVAYVNDERPIVWQGLRGLPDYRAVYQRLDRLHWTGTESFSEAPGAVVYLPVLYAPQGLMLRLGEASGASIEDSIRLARFANGLVAIALAAFGLALLPVGRSFALLLLLLPRNLLTFASNSADPILFGLALIILALGLRAWRSELTRTAWSSAAIFVAAGVRPPAAALAFPALVSAVRQRRWGSAGALVTSVLTAAMWMISMMPRFIDLRCPEAGPLGLKIGAFALNWPTLVAHTFSERGLYFYASFVGHYGLGDAVHGEVGTPLPDWIYATALPLLLFALWQDVVSRDRINPLARASLGLGGLGYVLLTFFSLYVACTNPTQPFVNGIQGRYFVPALFALGAALGGLARGERPAPRVFYGVLMVWVAACAVSMIGTGISIYDHFG